ncbi:mitochondrial tRNA-specific 2-thiouridylase 1-like [Anneissia japonica]|uniref:mitochondrial tRNA-specific 2-thiouridylase 1-like n=1 Tax=Anneissia japonica TaxID=1529436 RepID=UPI001425ACC6|nr:mitochondrial tRNA-specific 2-thiouridylase 1-like [Anneissia japonica]
MTSSLFNGLSRTVSHVACAISGGVDSAVAALILKSKGYQVTGIFMKNWDSLDENGECQADKDAEDAQYICKHLGISFQQVNFVKEYWHEVFSYLLKEYQAGFTPNPDILCNKYIKFDHFLQHALYTVGADALATGHYARLQEDQTDTTGKKVKLIKAIDLWKDQTFFLSQVKQESLQKVVFPVGDLTKSVVRQIALQAGLHKIVKKKESMGICFIGQRNFKEFIQEYVDPAPGNFISIEDAEVIGHHNGCFLYTIGQNAKIPGMDNKWFVVDKDPQTRTIYVAPSTSHPSLFTDSVITEPIHWINAMPAQLQQKEPFKCTFKFQHTDPPVDCMLTLNSDDSILISLVNPLRALTPGQFAVFYYGEQCLGGGRILRCGPSLYTLHKDDYHSGTWSIS